MDGDESESRDPLALSSTDSMHAAASNRACVESQYDEPPSPRSQGHALQTQSLTAPPKRSNKHWNEEEDTVLDRRGDDDGKSRQKDSEDRKSNKSRTDGGSPDYDEDKNARSRDEGSRLGRDDRQQKRSSNHSEDKSTWHPTESQNKASKNDTDSRQRSLTDEEKEQLKREWLKLTTQAPPRAMNAGVDMPKLHEILSIDGAASWWTGCDDTDMLHGGGNSYDEDSDVEFGEDESEPHGGKNWISFKDTRLPKSGPVAGRQYTRTYARPPGQRKDKHDRRDGDGDGDGKISQQHARANAGAQDVQPNALKWRGSSQLGREPVQHPREKMYDEVEAESEMLMSECDYKTIASVDSEPSTEGSHDWHDDATDANTRMSASAQEQQTRTPASRNNNDNTSNQSGGTALGNASARIKYEPIPQSFYDERVKIAQQTPGARLVWRGDGQGSPPGKPTPRISSPPSESQLNSSTSASALLQHQLGLVNIPLSPAVTSPRTIHLSPPNMSPPSAHQSPTQWQTNSRSQQMSQSPPQHLVTGRPTSPPSPHILVSPRNNHMTVTTSSVIIPRLFPQQGFMQQQQQQQQQRVVPGPNFSPRAQENRVYSPRIVSAPGMMSPRAQQQSMYSGPTVVVHNVSGTMCFNTPDPRVKHLFMF
jgi:hypothetical protein